MRRSFNHRSASQHPQCYRPLFRACRRVLIVRGLPDLAEQLWRVAQQVAKITSLAAILLHDIEECRIGAGSLALPVGKKDIGLPVIDRRFLPALEDGVPRLGMGGLCKYEAFFLADALQETGVDEVLAGDGGPLGFAPEAVERVRVKAKRDWLAFAFDVRVGA